MSKAKIKIKDLLEKHSIDLEFAKDILTEMGIQFKALTKTLEDEQVEEFEKKLLEKQRIGHETEKGKIVKPGIRRRTRQTEETHLTEETKVELKEETEEKDQVEKEEVPPQKETVETKPVEHIAPIKEEAKVDIVVESKAEEKAEEKEKEKEKEKTEPLSQVPKDKFIAKEEVVISIEQKEKIDKELEQSAQKVEGREVKLEKPVEFQKKDRQVVEKKPYERPQRPPFKRDKFDKQVKERERTIAPGKREIIMGPKDFKPEIPQTEQKTERRRPLEKKKELLKKDQLLELKEREDKLALQKKKKAEEEVIQKPVQKKPLKIGEAITVGELAKRMGVKLSLVIKTLLDFGVMATINHTIDADTAAIVASEFGYDVEKVSVDSEDLIAEEHKVEKEEDKVPRPPVVTIMGHVDHGKTSLLDAIRKTNVVASEAGGITQHIGAYQVEVGKGTITFLDTPGHEAFTAMRARGAKVTDIVILVVAADEGPMPQTIEALNHAKAANVPIIVAINKIDKPGANPERVKNMLAERGLIPEEWGGSTIYAEVSAKKNIGIQELLDLILIQAEVLELKANPNKLAKGIVIESKLDKGRGPVATILVEEGTLKVGDPFIVGTLYGKVRSLINDKGKRIDKATPSVPVEVLGLPGVPDAGEAFIVISDERKARQIATLREQKLKEKELAQKTKISLEDIYDKIQQGEIQELKVILKADVQGSCEAIVDSISKISASNVKVNVIHSGVGSISESDVMLAEASNAIIIGFNVKIDGKAQLLAEKNKIDIKIYNIIYELIDNIKLAMEGLLKPVDKEVTVGKAEVRQTFNVPRVGTIAGCFVTEGKVVRNNRVKVIRDNKVIFDGKILSLKRFKDDVREVQQGFECGVSLEGYNDIKSGDILEFYEIQQVAMKLEETPQT